jgi:putative ABC transport system substrate-binding protein
MNQVRRRRFLIAAGALLASPLARAQAGRTYRIGSVYLAASSTTKTYEEAFLDGLRELGFERGRNLVYDVRNCDGDPSRLPAAVDEVIALKPDLLAGIEQVAKVMRSKTATIPIVLTHSTDPVAAGLAKTLARPGGNVTGMAALTEVMSAKSVEILSEIVPQMKTVAVILDPNVPASANIERHVREAAMAKRATAVFYRARDRTELAQAFAATERDRPDGIINASGSGTLFGERQFIADNALRLRIPSAAATLASVEAGSLFAYSASLSGLFRQAASHAARILKGANPGELPIEQPTKFELVINMKTAKALGLTIPQSVLLRADRVIE